MNTGEQRWRGIEIAALLAIAAILLLCVGSRAYFLRQAQLSREAAHR